MIVIVLGPGPGVVLEPGTSMETFRHDRISGLFVHILVAHVRVLWFWPMTFDNQVQPLTIFGGFSELEHMSVAQKLLAHGVLLERPHVNCGASLARPGLGGSLVSVYS